MNPLRHATVLAWTVFLLAVPQALRAQPCVTKKTFDDAKALADTADSALVRFQKKQKLPPGKLTGGKAHLDAELARTKAEAATADQVLKDAEKALTDAKQDDAAFTAGTDKGKRLAELEALIKAHTAKVAKARKELDDQKTVVTKIDEARQAGVKAEGDIKKLMPGIDLGVEASGADDAKQQVDTDVANLQKAIQANQATAAGMVGKMTGGGTVKAEKNTIAVSTGLSCPEVVGLNVRIANKGRMIQKALDDYTAVDQKSPDPARDRAAFAKIAKDLETGIAEDQAALLAAAQSCQAAIHSNLTQLSKQRNQLEQLDPGKAIRNRQEELKTLEADNALTTESKRLTGERGVLKGLVTSATKNVTASQTAKATADAALEEVERNLEVKAGEETVKTAEPAYDAVVVRKDYEVKRATDDLKTATTFLDDLKEITPKVKAFKTHKKEWENRVKAFRAKANGDPAERDKLTAEKTVLVEEKNKVVALLKAKKLYKVKMCDKKKELRDALANRKTDLDPYNCFTDAATAIGEIDTKSKALASAVPPSWEFPDAPAPRRPTMLESLVCTLADFELESDMDELEGELPLDDLISEPTDSVPDDITKNTDAVKVPRYYVLLLTNASNGLYVGDEDGIKQSTRCGFVGGGIGCKPTDLITYKKLLGPFASQDEAQAALCKSITEARYFPAGIGMKGRWQGGNTWYGLWNASVSDCPR